MFSLMADRIQGLRQRYAEPQRHYHDQSHVDALLAGLAELGGQVTHRAAAELAIWYHDAIYDPAAADNEARSAALLRGEMTGLADTACLQLAETMVLATARHALPPDLANDIRRDVATFLDLDMAVLGQAPAIYDAYEAAIAAEYLPVHGAAAYRHGRAAFLRDAASRERLFLTERFHLLFDAPARANLHRALQALDGA